MLPSCSNHANRQDTDRHCFGKALQLDKDWLVRVETALIYLYHRMPSKALSYARQALEAGSDHSYAWYLQGLCQFKLGFSQPARESFQHCLALCPKHADSLNRLAEIDQAGWSFRGVWRRLWAKS